MISDDTLTNAGERMVVGRSWGYFAHLSIYTFALRFFTGNGTRVLDAGTGAGYGAAYLSRHGAKVLALDYSPVAIEHNRVRYAGDAVTYEVADLSAPLNLGDGVFDLVFSSNVFEHVGNVDGLAAECARVVAPSGVVIVAVPPIMSAEGMAMDMDNQFHVHHIPPSAWHAKLSRFFTDVRCHFHVGTGEFATVERNLAEIKLPPGQVTVRETDFDFPECSPADVESRPETITSVYVCRGRRQPPGPETIAERTPAAWREGEVAQRLLRAERDKVAASERRAEAAEQRAAQAR